jgi:hypothetical protein
VNAKNECQDYQQRRHIETKILVVQGTESRVVLHPYEGNLFDDVHASAESLSQVQEHFRGLQRRDHPNTPMYTLGYDSSLIKEVFCLIYIYCVFCMSH